MQAKLYDFNVIDRTIESDEPYSDNKQFTIQAFAKRENGETILLHIDDFHPFFYVKIPDDWASMMKRKVVNKFKKEMGSYYENSIIEHECKLEHHKKLYGFDGGRLYKFIKLVFKNSRALSRAKNIFYHKQCKSCGEWSPANQKACMHPGNIRGKCDCKEFPIRKQLDKGYRWGKTDDYLLSYEANIPPLLRFFHINNLSPSGWCEFNPDLMEEVETKTSLCDYEYRCSYLHILPIEKETMVPYKIMSFDIEADSSHGDFPLAVKSYKKLAMQIVDSVHKNTKYTLDNLVDYLKSCIYVAFGYCEGLDTLEYTIDKVYLDKPTEYPSKKELDQLITTWLESPIPLGPALKEKSREDAEIDPDEDDEHTNTSVFSRPKSTIVDLLLNNRIHRTTKVLGLENAFWQEEESSKGARQLFPKLKGDIITFIGSTFMNYGDEQPYRNHCLALGECSPVEGADIVSCNTEADVLTEWAKIVQEEDPDFVIGYNIFGFDYDYMFKRAKECGKKCVTDFVKVSKIMDDAVIKPWANPHFKNWRLKENVTRLASGEHELSYFLMSGRIQVDLLNLFRREHNLTSYKLDYVSGHFIGDYVKKIEVDEKEDEEDEDVDKSGSTKIYSQNLSGLEVDCFIHFEEIGHSTEYYNGGSKHRVTSICEDGTFIIGGIVNPDFNKKIRWCLAKDDVTPQDIFRLGRGSPDDKAIVAKYCIQDCNLVHQLMRKLDIITGFIEMAKICYVPMNFLVLRGQGIKLTSFIAQKCREKKTLMPDIQKDESQDGYEGAIVLDPKTGLYTDDPVACVDYSSLYPSSMISENLCHSSKVWTREYDLEENLIHETGMKDDETGDFKYDNLEGYTYVDITYDTYTYQRKTPKAAAEKIKIGYKTCRFAQYPDEQKAIMPSVLSELLKNRSATKKLMKKATDPFMKNVLDKRQLSIKLTANSLYGQCGAKTSTFYEKDVAASTTATGRKLLTYAKRVVEEVYGDRQCETKNHGPVLTKAEYVYGDSVLGDTPLLLRHKTTGLIAFHEIQHLSDTVEADQTQQVWQPYNLFKAGEPGRYNKEQLSVNEYQIYTSGGWSDIRRVIRHKTTKDIYRVTTHTGMVDVTEDHSLLDENKQIIKPNAATCGTRLLHHYPNVGQRMDKSHKLSDFTEYVERSHNVPLDEKRAFIWGFFFGDGSCGTYNCPSGVKHSWALNNKSYRLCSRLQYLCEDIYGRPFNIVNTIKSSGVYKIVPTGSIKSFVAEFWSQCYYNKHKIVPEEFLNASHDIKMAYLSGYYAADGAKCKTGCQTIRLSNKGKIGSAMLFYMFRSLGLNVSLNTRKDKPMITNLAITSGKQRKCPIAIKKNDILYKDYTDYVYDIETVEGNFNTGYPLIVKNTDSVFFTFHLTTLEGEKIIGKKALEITIELAQEVGHLATQFLKAPHDLEYEKTFKPFALLSKKRYVGILYEDDVNKGKRKEMGIVLKRRDNAPIVKDVYGGVIDILMKGGTVQKAIDFTQSQLQLLVDGKISIEKLIITKSLRSHYKNPTQIAHRVLADRIGRRDPGNKPRSGDRIAYAYIKNPDKKALQGDRIETPEYIRANELELDYSHYITNQIMKPLLQLFGLILKDIPAFKKNILQKRKFEKELERLEKELVPDKFLKKREQLENKMVKSLIFDNYIKK